MHHYFLKKNYLQCKIIILWFATSGKKVPKKQMGSFTPCQPVYFYIFQTFFCEMTKRQQLKQEQPQKKVATQIGQFWTPIMCDWTANFQQIILKHSGKKYFLNWHQECYTLRIEQDQVVVNKIFRQCRRGRAKLYIPSALNIDLILWHTQLIVCAVKC